MNGSPRIAIITGGAGAIGTAVATELRATGHTICTLDLTSSAPVTDRHFVVDAADEIQVDAAFDSIEKDLGVPIALVNATFISRRGAATDFSLADWNDVMRVNVTSYWLAARRAARTWIAEGVKGSIVNLGSITGGQNSVGRLGMAYGVGKAAILQLTRELAIEWAQYGIRVNAVQPAQVNSPALHGLLKEPGNERFRADVMNGIPLGRLAEPSDIANAVAFLLSTKASFITGVSLPVDGGNLAMNPGATNPLT